MSDRINSLTVVLERDLRDDDCEPLVQAIQQLRGVLSVTANVCNPGDHVAEMRVRRQFAQAINSVLNQPLE